MKRLQKKCFVVSTVIHGSLLLVFLIGPAFRKAPERQFRVAEINLMSSVAIEAALRQVAESTTVAPARGPILVEPEPVNVETPKPDPVPVKPPPMVQEVVHPKPPPKKSEKTQVPYPPKPKPKDPPKPKPEIKINFKPTNQKTTPNQAKLEAQRREKQRQQELDAQHQREMSQAALDALGQNLSKRVEVNATLSSGSALGNYRLWVKNAYDRAWVERACVEPMSVTRSRSMTKVRVIVNLDGSIASAKIIGASGSAELDRWVQDALRRVRKSGIGKKPPAGTSVRDRTFLINFNLKDGRITG